MTEAVEFRQEAGILEIRLNRPDKKNAITVAMYAAMAERLATAEADPAVRVVLFTGAGDAFCAGNDLKDFIASPPTGQDSPVFRFLRALAGATKVLIAAIQGPAVGIGTTMLLHCDLVVASRNARLSAVGTRSTAITCPARTLREAVRERTPSTLT